MNQCESTVYHEVEQGDIIASAQGKNFKIYLSTLLEFGVFLKAGCDAFQIVC